MKQYKYKYKYIYVWERNYQIIDLRYDKQYLIQLDSNTNEWQFHLNQLIGWINKPKILIYDTIDEKTIVYDVKKQQSFYIEFNEISSDRFPEIINLINYKIIGTSTYVPDFEYIKKHFSIRVDDQKYVPYLDNFISTNNFINLNTYQTTLISYYFDKIWSIKHNMLIPQRADSADLVIFYLPTDKYNVFLIKQIFFDGLLYNSHRFSLQEIINKMPINLCQTSNIFIQYAVNMKKSLITQAQIDLFNTKSIEYFNIIKGM